MVDTNTINFSLETERAEYVREILSHVHDSLKEKGYNPINQIVGYLISGDPAYIPRHNDARTLIRKVDRDLIIEELVKGYIQK